MTQQTKIEWTDFTVNFWEGCQKVGPGCDHCYAEARDTRFTGGKHWGPGAPRRKVKGGIAKLRKINREAEKFHAEHGHWPRVFCSSLSDMFDNAVSLEWVDDAFEAMEEAQNTRIQLLTKRVGNVIKRIPAKWHDGGWPAHVGLMITVVNQDEADRDILKLLALKAHLGIPWVGLSMEPLLGPVALQVPWRRIEPNISILVDALLGVGGTGEKCPCIDWIIVGGESGHNARPTHPDWIRSLRDQCEASGTPFLFKQFGEWGLVDGPMNGSLDAGSMVWDHDKFLAGRGPNSPPDILRKIGKKRAGRLLDGRTWDGVPT